ncbi:MAG: RecQ family ATP-dependent DNA helicase [Bacteroidales bacterium]|nr:RecQ family ATP-dependent DNA helicase [Bacteroidales bacterium]
MSIYTDILKKYWGYPGFRPLQEDIIVSAAEHKKDTLGLLPTGGGKSIIFQVPGLAHDGMCIVVSPLIALMKDQVENLKKQKISAAAIYTGMTKKEIDLTFENAIKGEYKFLYLSPERLGTNHFLEKLTQMKINLLAIDEAHCISQWGYDFRPSYLQIAEFRKYIPDVSVLALTATATPEVVVDIQDKLAFKEKNAFRKSFERKNVVYLVRRTEDKFGQLLKLVNGIQGTGIVYVRSRKLTEKVAAFLQSHGVSADFYHAGIEPREKDQKQNDWKHDKIRIIVATNAFGMGIDKSDVRFVIHIDLADSLEAYFQEAGRGGRDLNDAYAFLLFNDDDVQNLRDNVDKSYPPKETIFSVYEALCNYLKIPVGNGKGQEFEFVLSKFAQTFDFKPLEVYSSLKFLQKEKYLEYSDEIFTRSKIHVILSREDLYKFQVEKPKYDGFLKFLLRNFSGLFSEYVQIDEYQMAKMAKTEPRVIFMHLEKLAQAGVIDYLPKKTTPYITFLEDRQHPKSFRISSENYDMLKVKYIERIEAVISYVQREDKCRSRLLLEYFGEKDAPNCGRCDVCHNKKRKSPDGFKALRETIFGFLEVHNMSSKELIEKLTGDEDNIQRVIRSMLDDGEIIMTDDRKLKLVNKKNN